MPTMVRLPPLLLALACAVPAQALERAPLPSEAPMEACPQHGAGFFRVPGTSTCLRMSGRVAGTAVAGGGASRSLGMGRFAIDSRIPTEAGPARGFVRIDAGR